MMFRLIRENVERLVESEREKQALIKEGYKEISGTEDKPELPKDEEGAEDKSEPPKEEVKKEPKKKAAKA